VALDVTDIGLHFIEHGEFSNHLI